MSASIQTNTLLSHTTLLSPSRQIRLVLSWVSSGAFHTMACTMCSFSVPHNFKNAFVPSVSTCGRPWSTSQWHISGLSLKIPTRHGHLPLAASLAIYVLDLLLSMPWIGILTGIVICFDTPIAHHPISKITYFQNSHHLFSRNSRKSTHILVTCISLHSSTSRVKEVSWHTRLPIYK